MAWPYAAEAQASWITVEDQAALVIEALRRPDLVGATFAIGGPETLSGEEVAERCSAVLGQPLRYQPIPPDYFEEQLRPQIGEVPARAVADIYRWHLEHGTEAVIVRDMAGVLRELPAALTPLAQWFRQVAAAARAAAEPVS